MLLVIIMSVVTVLTTGLVPWTIHKWRHQSGCDVWEMGVIFSAAGLLLVIALSAGFFGGQYSESLRLPIQLEYLNTTIEEQEAYITFGDAGIGQGLEGMEIKREIQQTIRDRNDLIAEIEYRRVSPWYLFRP